MIIDQVTAVTWTDAAYFTYDENFADIILSNVTVNFSEITNSVTRYGDIKLQKTKNVYSEALAMRWNIEIGKAKKTVTWTTHSGFWICLHPTIGRWYPTNDQMLHYKRMPGDVYADTLKYGIVYKRGNKYGWAYCTSYIWSRYHPMAQESEDHDTLYLMFKCDDVSPRVIVENSKDQPLGAFTLKCRKAEFHLINS